MSKSLNNVIDPLDIMKEYGTDALRFSMISSAVPAVTYNSHKTALLAHEILPIKFGMPHGLFYPTSTIIPLSKFHFCREVWRIIGSPEDFGKLKPKSTPALNSMTLPRQLVLYTPSFGTNSAGGILSWPKFICKHPPHTDKLFSKHWLRYWTVFYGVCTPLCRTLLKNCGRHCMIKPVKKRPLI